MSGGQWMVVLIVAIVMIAKVVARGSHRRRIDDDDHAPSRDTADPEAARLRDEVRALKDRLAVLERIATDDRAGRDLDREIEALRGPRRDIDNLPR